MLFCLFGMLGMKTIATFPEIEKSAPGVILLIYLRGNQA